MSPVSHEILCHGDDQRRERGVKIRPIHRRQELSYCHSPGRFFGSIFDPSATCWDECARCIYLYGRCDCVWVAKLEVSSQKVNINLFRANPPSTSFSLRGSEASIRLSLLLSPPWFPSASPLTHTRLHARARLSFGSSSPEQQRAGEQKVDHHPKPQRNTATDHHRPKGCDIHQPLLACFALETLVEIVSCSDSWTGKTDPSHHPRTFNRLRHPGYILRFFGTLSFFGICSVSILCRLIPFPPRTSFSALYHRGRRRRRANWTKS